MPHGNQASDTAGSAKYSAGDRHASDDNSLGASNIEGMSHCCVMCATEVARLATRGPCTRQGAACLLHQGSRKREWVSLMCRFWPQRPIWPNSDLESE